MRDGILVWYLIQGRQCVLTGSNVSAGSIRKRIRLQMHLIAMEPQFALDKPAHGARINNMFLLQYALRQLLLAIAAQNRYRSLGHDRPVIEIGRHEMHRCAM